MAFKLNIPMSEEARVRLDAVRREIGRLFLLSDRWLAEELLRLARRARAEFPDKLKDPHGITYEPNFVWHIVPEVAKRLGATRLLPNEASDADIVSLQPQEMRQAAGGYLQNMVLDRWGLLIKGATPTACEILNHSVANGNPVAFAIDRLAPPPEPGQDEYDYIARHVREISQARGHRETARWSPELQNDPVSDEEAALGPRVM